MTRNRFPTIEQLESRQLLSGTVSPGLLAASSPTTPIVTPIIPIVTGPTLHLTAGTPFSGKVGFYASPVLDPPLGYSATINWGDGASSKATLSYGEQRNSFGVIISGVHAYAKHGTYSVKITFVTSPISPKSTLPTTILEYIIDKAIVAARPANSPGGVTIHELPGKAFSAVVGTFDTIAPAIGLTATINWGDGISSVGTLKAKPTGIDTLEFTITGKHTYALAGTYSIHILVKKPSATVAGTPAIVASIFSTAIVAGIIPIGVQS